MKKIKTSNNKQGAALMTVIVVMAMMMILLVSSLSVSITASNQTYSTFEEQQAYYTARSTLEGFGATLNNDTTFDAYLATFARNASINDEKTTPTAVSVPGYGDVKVTVKKVAADTVKVTAEVELLGEKNTTSMVLQIPPPEDVISFNNAAVSLGTNNYNSDYVSEGGMAGKGYFKTNNNMIINGNVYNAGIFRLQNNTVINGGVGESSLTIESTDRIELDGSFKVIPLDGMANCYMTTVEFYSDNIDSGSTIGTALKPVDIYAKAIHINSGSGKFYGDIYISQPENGYIPAFNVNRIYGGVYYGDIFVDGDLHLNGGATLDGGNVYATGNISYDPYYPPILKNGATLNGLYATTVPYTKPTPENVYFSSLIDKTSATGEYYKPLELMNLPAILFGMTYDLSDPNAVVDGVYTISGSGRLTGQLQQGVQYVFEVGDTPVHFKWPDNKIELDSNHEDIIIKRADPTSNTNVYFYLDNDLTIGAGKKIMTNVTNDMLTNGDTFYTGNSADSSKQLSDLQNIFWMVEDNVDIQVTGGGIVEGKFYGPNATFNLNGVASFNFRVSRDGTNVAEFPTSVIGSIIGNDVQLNNDTGILFSRGSGAPPPPPGQELGSFKVINYQRS